MTIGQDIDTPSFLVGFDLALIAMTIGIGTDTPSVPPTGFEFALIAIAIGIGHDPLSLIATAIGIGKVTPSLCLTIDQLTGVCTASEPFLLISRG